MMTEELRHKPWEAAKDMIPKEIYLPRGMLGDEERRMLWWIANRDFKGEGVIVDAGAYIGSSAFCFGSGLAHGNVARGAVPLIHSYDFFAAFDDYVAATITEQLRPTAAGEDYHDIFKWQTGRYKDMITSHPGDFCNQHWNGRPIELLFIDIAKTPELNGHLVREMFGSLIPGRSVLIQQDFYHCWHPYLHITMEYFRDNFEVVDGYVAWQSRVYRYVKEMSPAAIAEMAAYRFTLDEKLALLDGLVARETGNLKAMAEVVRLCEILNEGDHDRFLHEYAAFWTRWPENTGELWERQAREVRADFDRKTAPPA